MEANRKFKNSKKLFFLVEIDKHMTVENISMTRKIEAEVLV